MKRRVLRVVGLLLFCGAFAQIAATQEGTDRLLDSGWRFRAVEGSAVPQEFSAAKQWQTAQVPGVVQTDLLRARLIPDPFYRDNEARLQWVGTTDWEYVKTFTLTRADVERKHLELVFDGLDTFADVSVNGHKMLTADNMFRQWRVPAKDAVHAGDNQLRIVFHSPVTRLIPVVKAMPYILPTIAQTPEIRDAGALVEPYVRKAPYNFGWDWGPTYITAGIWHDVHVVTWDDLRVDDAGILQQSVTPQVAHLSADVRLDAAPGPLEISVSYKPLNASGRPGTWLPAARRVVTAAEGANELTLPFQIAKPKLWWPNGYGAQDRYAFRITVRRGGSLIASREIRTGLRSVELRRQPDEWGKSFEFVVNGVPIFAKGADVIPFDSFPTRVTPTDHRRILSAARDANMNMVRDWGGGYYETDDYYDTADALGIMVWQEFMFGGAMVPGDPAFRANVAEEAKQQVLRLRNHPSIVMWCGNNEVETGWQHWGDRQDFKASITPAQREFVWQSYLLMMNDVLKSAVERYAPGAAYMPSSPSNNHDEEADSDTNGDRHYWSVWHALTPISEYNNQHPRFMSEFGFQSFPGMETIRSFTLPEDLAIGSPVMQAHQKNKGGNDRIHTYMLREYNEPKDFPAFVYLSQVLQAEAIKVGAEDLRRSRPRTMGSLFWQLNDCWPVASWSSIDYYGRWKALQFYARRFYSPVLVSPLFKDGNVETWIVSDLQKPTTATLQVELEDFSGKVIAHEETPITIAPLSSTRVNTTTIAPLVNGADPKTLFVEYRVVSGSQVMSTNELYFDVPKALALPAPKVQASWNGANLTLSSDALARDVQLSFGSNDAVVSDNFFTLLPGKPTTVQVTGASAEALRQSLQITTLTGAYR